MTQTSVEAERRDVPGVMALFLGALLTATGYGATFLLDRHFGQFGGTEIDTGTVLMAAMFGTFVGVPLVGWNIGRIEAARCSGLGALSIALGFLLLAFSQEASVLSMIGGFAVGLGWGAFYLAAPMALSQRVTDDDRAYWFIRFAAFQMAGIGISPFLAELALSVSGVSTGMVFASVAACCLLAGYFQFRFASIAQPLSAVAASTSGVAWTSALGPLLAGPSRFPIMMVALGAAAFGGVMTFQHAVVEGTGLSAATYFAVYSVTVVIARWFFAAPVSRIPPRRAVPALLVIMTAGLAVLLGASAGSFGLVAQVVSAALFGIGYGLVYPLIQAQAVNDAGDPALKDAALTWFVMSYFVGIFGFPLLGGAITVAFGTQALILTLTAIGALELVLALIRNQAVRRRAAGV